MCKLLRTDAIVFLSKNRVCNALHTHVVPARTSGFRTPSVPSNAEGRDISLACRVLRIIHSTLSGRNRIRTRGAIAIFFAQIVQCRAVVRCSIRNLAPKLLTMDKGGMTWGSQRRTHKSIDCPERNYILICTDGRGIRMRQSWNRMSLPRARSRLNWPQPTGGLRHSPSVQNFRVVRFWSFLLLTLFFARGHLLAQTSVTTWHYDNARTSANTSEITLTPSNVNSTSFGKLFTDPVDGFIVGHPLYLPNVNFPGQGVHNVVYVATMHDSVYAFDADDATDPTPLWMTSILTYSAPWCDIGSGEREKGCRNDRVDRGGHRLYTCDRSCDRHSLPCC